MWLILCWGSSYIFLGAANAIVTHQHKDFSFRLPHLICRLCLHTLTHTPTIRPQTSLTAANAFHFCYVTFRKNGGETKRVDAHTNTQTRKPPMCLPWVRPVCRPGSRLWCDTPWRGRWRGRKWLIWGAWWSRRWVIGPRGSRCPAFLSGCGRPRHPSGCSTAWWSSPLLPPPRPTVRFGQEDRKSHTSVGDDKKKRKKETEIVTTCGGVGSGEKSFLEREKMRTRED